MMKSIRKKNNGGGHGQCEDHDAGQHDLAAGGPDNLGHFRADLLDELKRVCHGSCPVRFAFRGRYALRPPGFNPWKSVPRGRVVKWCQVPICFGPGAHAPQGRIRGRGRGDRSGGPSSSASGLTRFPSASAFCSTSWEETRGRAGLFALFQGPLEAERRPEETPTIPPTT